MDDLKESTKKIQEKYMDMVMMRKNNTNGGFEDGIDHQGIRGGGGKGAAETTTKESSNSSSSSSRRERSRSRWGEIMKKPEIVQRIIEQGRFSVYNVMKLSCVSRVWQSVSLQFMFKKFTMFDLGVMDRAGLEMDEKIMFNRLLLLALNNHQSMIESSSTTTDNKPTTSSSSLIFPYFTRLHPDFILQIAKSSPWLKRVKIPVLHSFIPIRTLLQALEYWTELEEFEIINLRRQSIDYTTDVIISKLASNCKKLKRLTYFYGRTSTQTAGLMITNANGGGLPKLEYLDLRFSELYLEDLWKIVNHHHKNHHDHLLELNISHCIMTCDDINHYHRHKYLKKIFLEETTDFSSVRIICCENTTCNCYKC